MYLYLRFSIVFYFVLNTFLNISSFILSSLILFLSFSSSCFNYFRSSCKLSLFALKNPIFSLSIWSCSPYSLTSWACLSNFSFSMQYRSSSSYRASFSVTTLLCSSSNSCCFFSNSYSCLITSFIVSWTADSFSLNSFSWATLSTLKFSWAY